VKSWTPVSHGHRMRVKTAAVQGVPVTAVRVTSPSFAHQPQLNVAYTASCQCFLFSTVENVEEVEEVEVVAVVLTVVVMTGLEVIVAVVAVEIGMMTVTVTVSATVSATVTVTVSATVTVTVREATGSEVRGTVALIVIASEVRGTGTAPGTRTPFRLCSLRLFGAVCCCCMRDGVFSNDILRLASVSIARVHGSSPD
jgi:hypothetical protein